MRTLLFLTCLCFILPVQPNNDVQRYIYCESCLGAAQEIERTLKAVPAERRETEVENLLSGRFCRKLSHVHDHVTIDKMTSSCKHLLASHHDQFQKALLKKEPEHLDILLCYEQSTACVGVKRHSFEGSNKKAFEESHIEALLRDNKEHVRIARPIKPVELSRDEL